MKLLKVKIENFGKLSNVEFDFNSGLNNFNYENGWGKTTLTNFIKAMFYGVTHAGNAKDLEKNEGLKYLPWQGGVYGGSLEFEHKDKKYRILRTFGKSAKDDKFQLFDMATNKPSTDFSEDIGNELFNVSKETYGRSVHVILGETPAGSNDISAKLTNLIEAGDISDFDDAVAKLKLKSSAIKPERKSSVNPGLLVRTENKIDENTDELKRIATLEIQNKALQDMIESIKKEVNGLENKQKEVSKVLAESAKFEGKIRYEQLKADLKSAEDNRDQIKDFFIGSIPDNSYLENIKKISSDYVTVTSNISKDSATQSEIDKYNELKNYFGGDVPSQQQIDDCVEANASFSKLMQLNGEKKLSENETNELNSLKGKFEGKNISKEILESNTENFNSLSTLKDQIYAAQNEKMTVENQLNVAKSVKTSNVKRMICFGLGAVAITCAVILFLFVQSIVGAAVAGGLGIILFVAGVIFKAPVQDFSRLEQALNVAQQKCKTLADQFENASQAVKGFVNSFIPGAAVSATVFSQIGIDFSRYETLMKKFNDYHKWVDENSSSLEKYTGVLKDFALRYFKSNNIEDMGTKIQIISSKRNEFFNLQEKINSDTNNSKEKENLEKQLGLILNDFKTNKSLSFDKQVDEISAKTIDLSNAKENVKDAEQKIQDFENDPNNDVASFEKLVKPAESVDQLNSKMQVISDEINSKNRDISNYQQQMDNNFPDIDRKEDIETDIVRCKEEVSQLKEDLKLYTKTLELLTAAKENINASYSDPMKTGFDNYVKLVGGKLKLSIDTDLKVSVEGGAGVYGSEYLSEGYKDLVNFCSRMALIDALFKDVKPPVILDDPFVNLDDDKVDNALSVVRTMAKDKQIFYFTCHKSRQV